MNGRVIIFCACIAAFAAVLVGRLYHVQVIDGAWFAKQANDNRMFSQKIDAERGVLLDRYGQPLTRNTPSYYRERNPNSLYSEREPLSHEQALQAMASGSASAVGYTLDRATTHSFATSPVVGYVGAVTAEELEKNPQLAVFDKTGKLGLERVLDSRLRGVDGSIQFEINATGQKQRELHRESARSGETVTTTIDPYLSEVVYRAMGDAMGAVLIADADTGELLAAVSAPSFDASIMDQHYTDEETERKRQQTVAGFFSHPRQLFFNRAISGQYPPGSVFKLVTALSGLESGALNPSQTVLDEGVLKIGEDYSYANWYYTQYGRVEGEIALQRALARSNDIYFYKAAEWIGPERLAQFARLFGFGRKTGIELVGEAAGLVPDPAWKEETLGERWFLGNTYHLGIGQDNLLVTPLQVLQLLQAVGNQGMVCPPHLTRRSATESNQNSLRPAECSELGITDEHLEVVLKGMLDACSEGGTAYPLFPYNTEHRQPELTALEEITNGAIACKTGTAEFGQADGKGHRRTHAWLGAIVGTAKLQAELKAGQATATGSATVSATASAQPSQSLAASAVQGVDVNDLAWRNAWREQAAKTGLPERLAIVVLVESSDVQPFAEGSREAAPVVKAVLDWMGL